MAVVTTKSLALTNRDATPVILSNDILARGIVKHAAGVIAFANGDSTASAYKFCSIPSNAYLVNVIFSSDAMGGAAAGTFDIYDTTVNGGLIVPTTGTKLVNGGVSTVALLTDTMILGGGTTAAGFTNANSEKFLWQVLGLAVDPNKYYDVVMTLTAPTAAAGSAALNVLYI